MLDTILPILRWLGGDAFRVRTRRHLLAAFAVSGAIGLYGACDAWDVMKPIARDPGPEVLPPDQGDVRFGVPLATRKQVFAGFAAAEPGQRAEGRASFHGPGLDWSAEDHRGSFERKTAAQLSAQYGLNLTQVYLILDEGIRERWVDPDAGGPLPGTTEPLNPRRKYGW